MAALNDRSSATAEAYDTALNRGLSLSGESGALRPRTRPMARRAPVRSRRAAVLHPRLRVRHGGAAELLGQLHARTVVGVDASREPRRRATCADASAVQVHERPRGGRTVRARILQRRLPSRRPERRRLRWLRASLALGGRILRPLGEQPVESGHAAVSGAFRSIATRSCCRRHAASCSAPDSTCPNGLLFLFPRMLSVLRPLEARLARVPAGAQYMVLCRKR